jgi:hypothetical protein
MKLLTAILNKPVSVFWLYFVLGFVVIWGLPWFPTKTDNLAPVNVAYTVPFRNWMEILAIHVVISVVLGIIATLLHKGIAMLLQKPSRDDTASGGIIGEQSQGS